MDASRRTLRLAQSHLKETRMFDLFHQILGRHIPDPSHNQWDRGRFTSVCLRCRRDMTRLPGLPWRVGTAE